MSDERTRPIWLQRLFDKRGKVAIGQPEALDMLTYIEQLEAEYINPEPIIEGDEIEGYRVLIPHKRPEYLAWNITRGGAEEWLRHFKQMRWPERD